MPKESVSVTITRMQDDIKHTSEAVDPVELKLDEFIKASQQHFAAKWTEDAIKWFLFALAGLVVTYLFFRIVGININTFSLQ
jgi:hypothetical protein